MGDIGDRSIQSMMDFRKSAYYSVIDLQRDMPPDLTRAEGQIFSKVFYRVYGDTKSRIMALAAALGAVSRIQAGLAVKSRYPHGNGIAGWGVHFSDSDQRDWTGEYFSKRTDLHLKRQAYPLYFNHDYSQPPIGYVKDWQRFESWGVWFRCVLTTPNTSEFMADTAAGRFGFSTGTDPAKMQKARDGEILNWPIWEISAAETPAEIGLGSIIVDPTP